MKKKLILIFGVMLILTGCGDSRKVIENKVIGRYEKNIFPFFNNNGLQMLQDAGFDYKETIITGEGKVEMYLHFDENRYSIYISGEKLKNYLNGKTIEGCTIEDTDATCKVNAEINDGKLIMQPTGDNHIDNYLNNKDVLVNVLTLNKDYVKQYPLSAGIEYRSRYTEKSTIINLVGYNNLAYNDPNRVYFKERNVNDIGSLELDYTVHEEESNAYKIIFCEGIDKKGFITSGNVISLKFSKRGNNE